MSGNVAAKQAFMSNDRWVWSDEDADVELLEPRVRVSVTKNVLTFGRSEAKPPLEHSFTIINHSDHPIAFKIVSSDNYGYFVDKKMGIIGGERLRALPFVRTRNSQQITVFRRPVNCFRQDYNEPNRLKQQHKQRMHVLVAPVFSWTANPASAFLFTRCFEKLRICLEFTGKDPSPKDTAKLCVNRRGWNTWSGTKDELK